jgi:hypothetical protein
MPGMEAMKAFRPATPDGHNIVESMFKTALECNALTTTPATCAANAKCFFVDNECLYNFFDSTPGQPSSCKDSEKVAVTMASLMMERETKCEAMRTEATCKVATKCAWKYATPPTLHGPTSSYVTPTPDPNLWGWCTFDSSTLMGGALMDVVGPDSMAHLIVKLGMVADECKAKVKTIPSAALAPAPAPSTPSMMKNNGTSNATNATGRKLLQYADAESTCNVGLSKLNPVDPIA